MSSVFGCVLEDSRVDKEDISSGQIVNNKLISAAFIHGVYVIDIEDAQGTVQKKLIRE